MYITVISSFEALPGIRRDWDAAYAADPEAQFFLSWNWLSGWLKQLHSRWFILAAKPTSESDAYVAFLPLKLSSRKNEDGTTIKEVAMAGNGGADYTGLICRPEFEECAIVSFSIYLNSKAWSNLHLENILLSDRRLGLLLKHFSRNNFDVLRIEQVDKAGVNHSICPYVELPGDWETYLGTCLSANTRQKARRFLRKVEASDELRITHADAASIRGDVEMLLRFWALKWGVVKGHKIKHIVPFVRGMLLHCHDQGCLFFPVIWKDGAPVGALAILIDPLKRSLFFYITGRDETVASPPPGFILHAYSIRWAVSQGFRVYDFLRGNESYKYQFGAQERRIRHLVIRAKAGRQIGHIGATPYANAEARRTAHGPSLLVSAAS